MRKSQASKVSMIEIDKINILNPRVRNKKVFTQVVDNIAQVGLKRPITVTPCRSGTEGKDYDLVCGQGRLEAFLSCGQTHIPAIVIDATEEQALIMSLVENLARRHQRAQDLLQAIEILEKQGYNIHQISEKTGLTDSYIDGVLKLMRQGEERLLTAVEGGQIPLTVAIRIAETPDEQIQQVLHESYEAKLLKGKRLIQARRLLEKRKTRGKGFVKGGTPPTRGGKTGVISVQQVMKVYQKEVDRKRLLTRRAEIASSRLLIVIESLRRLFKEEHFNVLLKAENITTLPKPIADLIAGKEPMA